MIRIGLIAATGLMALALAACGERGNNKPTATENNAQPQQPQGTMPQQQGTMPQQQQPQPTTGEGEHH